MMTTTTGYSALIPLSLVKGVYDYKAIKTEESSHYPLIRFFTKSASASNIVVNMPLSKLKNPHDIREYHKADSTLTNNFSPFLYLITTTITTITTIMTTSMLLISASIT